MAIRFASVKRYGGEGAESLLPFYWQLLRSAAQGEYYLQQCRERKKIVVHKS